MAQKNTNHVCPHRPEVMFSSMPWTAWHLFTNSSCTRDLGRDGSSTGQFMTLVAQPYPMKLRNRVAKAVNHSVVSKLGAALWKFFQGLQPATNLVQ